MSARILFVALLLLGYGCSARAADFNVGSVYFGFEGYGDFRLVIPSEQVSWFDGGLGKLRYGDTSGDPEFHFSEGFVQFHATTGDLLAMVAIRAEAPQQDTLLDLTEAFIRYRPVSTSQFRWQVRAGMFFAPFSLENTEIGWQSPWTLTWSAINTWFGEELRTLGAEARVEWRTDQRVVGLVGSAYGWNDPLGVLVADRGWALGDWVTGIEHRPRLPDVFAAGLGMPIPARTYEFIEIDDKVGWYAGATWDETGVGHIDIFRYHNEADPAAFRKVFAWETYFWSGGASTQIGPVTILAQGIHGATFIEPFPGGLFETKFEAFYGLVGWETGDWRFAGRVDTFSTDEGLPFPGTPERERGHAFTLAANWLPTDWVRLTGEWVQVDSTRRQRSSAGLAENQVENMFQLSARLFF